MILLKNATVLTMDPKKSLLRGATLQIQENRIVKVSASSIKPPKNSKTIDCKGLTLLPGFVQTHVHLCQTLFRHQADDLELLDWLQKKIWPLEASHTESSLTLSAELGIRELLASGTTTINDMATVWHTESIFRAAKKAGIRAIIGKCLMDSSYCPSYLKQKTKVAMDETLELLAAYPKNPSAKLQASLAPRFALSCSERLLQEVAKISQSTGALVHTHASENREEIKLVKQSTGYDNMEYFNRLKLLGENTVIAHCIHLNDKEVTLLKNSQTGVAHCPSSNLKLGSGIARIAEYKRKGLRLSIGTDGAPCNNRHDIFREMRLTALLQAELERPGRLTALEVLELATIKGAEVLGLASETGSLTVGKLADLVALDLDQIPTFSDAESLDEIASQIVYGAGPENVAWTMVDGKIVYKKSGSERKDKALLKDVRSELKALKKRASKLLPL